MGSSSSRTASGRPRPWASSARAQAAVDGDRAQAELVRDLHRALGVGAARLFAAEAGLQLGQRHQGEGQRAGLAGLLERADGLVRARQPLAPAAAAEVDLRAQGLGEAEVREAARVPGPAHPPPTRRSAASKSPSQLRGVSGQHDGLALGRQRLDGLQVALDAREQRPRLPAPPGEGEGGGERAEQLGRPLRGQVRGRLLHASQRVVAAPGHRPRQARVAEHLGGPPGVSRPRPAGLAHQERERLVGAAREHGEEAPQVGGLRPQRAGRPGLPQALHDRRGPRGIAGGEPHLRGGEEVAAGPLGRLGEGRRPLEQGRGGRVAGAAGRAGRRALERPRDLRVRPDRRLGQVPGPVLEVALGVERRGERPVGRAPLGRRAELQQHRPQDRVAQPRPLVLEGEEAGLLGRDQVVARQAQLAQRGRQRPERPVDADGRGRQRATRPRGERLDAAPVGVGDALAGPQRARQRRPPGPLVRAHRPRQLDDGQRAARGHGEHLARDVRDQRGVGGGRLEELAVGRGGQRLELQLGEPRHLDALERGVARGSEHGDRLVIDAAGAEGQGLARRLVEPVGVVDHDQQRRLGRDRPDQAQGRGVGGEAVRGRGRAERQRGPEGGALGHGERRQAFEHRGQQVRERGKGQPRLRLARARPQDPEALRRRGRRPRAGPSCRRRARPRGRRRGPPPDGRRPEPS